MASSERRAAAHEQIFGPRGPTRGPPPRGYERVESPYSTYSQYHNYPSSSPAMYYPQPPPAQAQHPHVHAHYGQPQYSPQPPPSGPMYGPRPSPAPRARSLMSGGGGNGYPVGIIQPRPLPEETPDPAIERLTQQGLTPAQAYQAQYQQTTPRPFQLPLVEVTPDPPLSGPWDHERYEDDVRSERSSIRDWASSRHSMYQPGQSPPLQTSMQRPQLMQLDTTLAAQASPAAHTTGDTQLSYYHSESTSPSPPISNAPVNLNPSASRRSIESVRTVPVGTNTGSIGRRGHTYTGSIGNTPSDRIRSMSASGSTARPPLPLPRPQHHTSRRRPLVYPALLSRVADAFRQRIPLNDRTKDGLTYPAAFDGREAVDLIAYIIKTSDRNLALLLGRALDAQKFFHDVTYDHRLRDSPAEIYQFSGPRPVTSWDTDGAEDGESTPVRPGLLGPGQGSGSGSGVGSANAGGNAATESEEDAVPLPVGVFTLLTECYSPTCSRDKVCYCIGCPRRVEQTTRQQSQRSLVTNSTASATSVLSGTTIAAGGVTAMAGRLIKGNSSKESLIDHGVKEPGQLWVQSVPQEIVDSVSDQERKRQEAINEVIYTERDFVRDLEYLRDRWMGPLRTGDVIPEERREDFVQQVFWNVEDILDVNTRLRDLLTKRQNAYPIVETIGDIFLELVPHFSPFVLYGKHQLYGKYEFEKEKSTNSAFASFVETVERLPESRKLELNGYLTKPTTRLARYPLLLEVVLKHTPDDNVDRVAIPKVVAIVRDFLKKVNEESGRTENRFNLLQLDKGLAFRPGEEVDLRLKDEQRQLVYKGPLKRRGGTANENGDLQIFLFDHALLIVKSKMVNKHEQLKVFKRPIPLELLVVSTPDENANRAARPRTTLIRPNSNGHPTNGTSPPTAPIRPDSQKSGYQLTFSYLGKKGYSLTLWAPTVIARKKWVDNIVAQQDAMRERSMIFDTYMLSEGVFLDEAKVNCSVPYDYGRRFVYGTDDGIYFQSLHDGVGKPMRRIALTDVQQIDILEDYQLLVALAERSVVTFPLEAIDVDNPSPMRHVEEPLKRMKRIASHTSFFKAGYCLGRTLVCVVKASSLSSTIKVLEPIEQSIRGKSKPTFKKLLQGGNDTLKVFKEFYIPNESLSIHFLKTKLCVACTTGFEIVDLETLDTQALLDPVDVSLDFVQHREDVRPLSIYRIDGEFLLCYTEFAFFVNKSGWRSKKDVIIYWEGTPTAFALHYPYVMAFDPTFIEIRHVEDGSLVQVIRGSNLRLLFADTQPSVMNSMSSSASIRSGSSTAHSHYQMQYNHSYGGHSPYAQYGQPAGYGHGMQMVLYAQQQQQQQPRRPHVRDEIILVSDDKVMAVRLAPPSRPSDTASISSKTAVTVSTRA
ncbi:Rho1 guanine nucleotide exchange factor 1 [Schizosaccharomyces pombe 972h-] [Rhizoctonia solani]|uniref:Rho1 guanine nucleotide exchange factor 1 [Schizosaccharomyces pombe 972h-] n=1 Tax=Rhizoctonia solani TaxID=456999 RepID=A0A0K6G816_9AGAM|nr:Rho1 guanine nucleotide exchange factor 1 [Schizosaccharomyces pombe 972h-] [Rhizoctonia solani]